MHCNTDGYSIYSNNEAVSRIYSRQRNARPYWRNPTFSCPSFSSPAFSTPVFWLSSIFQFVIFQSCKFQSPARLTWASTSLRATCILRFGKVPRAEARFCECSAWIYSVVLYSAWWVYCTLLTRNVELAVRLHIERHRALSFEDGATQSVQSSHRRGRHVRFRPATSSLHCLLVLDPSTRHTCSHLSTSSWVQWLCIDSNSVIIIALLHNYWSVISISTRLKLVA